MEWRQTQDRSYELRVDGEEVAGMSLVERDGRHGWFWHTYINGDEGFCETLEQAKAEAERSTSPHRLN